MLDLDRRLEDLRRGKLSDEARLETALILVEPFHQEDRAMEVLQDLLEANPRADAARLWCSYLLAHYWMDPTSLELARPHLQRLRNSTVEIAAAALQLLACVERELGEENSEALLEESVQLCPSWVINRYLWAEALLERGSVSAAEEQLHQALENFREHEPSQDIAQREFEAFFVGKNSAGLKREIERRLTELKAESGTVGEE